MKRFLALLAAVAMVAVALQVRGRLQEGGGGGGGGAPRLVCAPEVAAACQVLDERGGLEVTVEEAGLTARRLTDADVDQADPGLDGWLVPAPWPAMVDEARQRAGLPPLFAEITPALARSPLVMALWEDRARVLEGSCGGVVGWRCVGEAAGGSWSDLGGPQSWGQVKPGHADPGLSAGGLLVLAQAAGDFLGATDFSTRDLQDDAFLGWLTELEQAVPSQLRTADSALEQMVRFGPAGADAVGGLEAEAGPLLARSADRARSLMLRYPDPVVTADAILAPLAGSAHQDRLRDLVRGADVAAALAAAGWRVQGRPLVAGVPSEFVLPGESGLPSPGALAALQAVVQEVTR